MGSSGWMSDFISSSRKVWGDRWDYSSSTKTSGANATVIIQCRDHGEFSQRPSSHLSGMVGCHRCRRQIRTVEDLILYSKDVWGEHRWEYGRTTLAKGKQKTTFTCPDHGDYVQSVDHHLGGHLGCRMCRSNYVGTQEWISLAVEATGDEWDYSRVEYVDNTTPVEIVCKEHGSFFQNPTNHLRGHVGCKRCNGRMGTTEEFILRANEVWDGRWDYTSTEYNGYKNEVTITCKDHGPFTQVAEYHLLGGVGCRECYSLVLTEDEVISRVIDVWGDDKWDLSNIQWVNYEIPIRVVCLEHCTELYAKVGNLLQGKNCCRKCQSHGVSAAEKEIFEFVRSLDVEVIPNDRDALDGVEVDVYVPSKNVAIEYNGLYYHSEKFKDKNFHRNKTMKAMERGIILVHIWEDEWRNKRSIVEEHIKNLLKVSDRRKISARDCRVVDVTSLEARRFLDSYHIQGGTDGTYTFGLEYDDELVAVAVFTKRTENEYLLDRYATSENVRGGHSKLISVFERTLPHASLVTFADLAYSYGNLYESTGWINDGEIPPDYRYVVKGKRKHKFNYRKSRFINDFSLQYVEGMTEHELATLNGLYRIYDCGKIRYRR